MFQGEENCSSALDDGYDSFPRKEDIQSVVVEDHLPIENIKMDVQVDDQDQETLSYKIDTHENESHIQDEVECSSLIQACNSSNDLQQEYSGSEGSPNTNKLVSNLIISSGNDDVRLRKMLSTRNNETKEEKYEISELKSNTELQAELKLEQTEEQLNSEKLNENLETVLHDGVDNLNITLSIDKEIDEELLADSIQEILCKDDDSEVNEKTFDEINALKVFEGISEDHIVSAVGTVRGIKNGVKERLLSYLSHCEENEKEKEKRKKVNEDIYLTLEKSEIKNCKTEMLESFFENKVIIYTTSLGLIRKTKSDCLYVRKAFRNLMFKTEERDITNQLYRNKYRKYFDGLLPPQVVINGKYVGGRNVVEKLIETGEILKLCQDIERINYNIVPCLSCAGYSYINCPRCLGSGRAKTLRYTGTRQLNYLKCTYCENGLLRCVECINSIH